MGWWDVSDGGSSELDAAVIVDVDDLGTLDWLFVFELGDSERAPSGFCLLVVHSDIKLLAYK